MRLVCALVTLFAAAGQVAVLSADTDATVAVSVRVSSRLSLRVSTNVLEFTVPDGSRSATSVVEFTAAARLASGSGVVLNVEPGEAVHGPGGAADVDTEITFAGEGNGTRAGTLTPSTAAIAATWQGSGRRHGRIIFTLHTSSPGVYRVPVQLVLTTP